MIRINKWGVIVLSTVTLVLTFFSLESNPTSIFFESLESKTHEGKPVYNEISFKKENNQDLWLMRQSHLGSQAKLDRWDRLAIVVDHQTKEARFFQFKPGEKLEFAPKEEQAPYKARCFACHANGPRVVRPNWESSKIKPSLKEKVRIAFWNLKIKTYGKLTSVSVKTFTQDAPFRSALAIAGRPLGLQTCVTCHSETGIRAPLKLEHVSTAKFLIQQNIMPPFPFKITAADQKEIEKF